VASSVITMESLKRKLSTDATVGDDDDEQVVKRVHRLNGEDPPATCSCKLVVQQQEEIERLKALLQAKESSPVVASTTTTPTTSLEEKVNRLTALIEKQQEAKPAAVANYSLDSLHNKVDKLVRKCFKNIFFNYKDNSSIGVQGPRANF